jgi:CRP-like cAMP-binding protein
MTEQLYAKPLFEDFSEEEMQELLGFSRAIKFEAGDYLFRQDDISQSIYIIFSGNVELSAINVNEEEISFPVVGNGTVLGEIAFFDGKPRTASAKALDTLETIIFTHEDFTRLEEENPKLAIRILREFGRITAERLRWADEILIEIIK